PTAPQVLTNPMATPGVAGQLSRAPLKMPAKGKPAIMPVKKMARVAMPTVVNKPIQENPRARPALADTRSNLVERIFFPRMIPPRGREIIPSNNTAEPTIPAVLGSRWMLLINNVFTHTPAAIITPKLPSCAHDSSQILGLAKTLVQLILGLVVWLGVSGAKKCHNTANTPAIPPVTKKTPCQPTAARS